MSPSDERKKLYQHLQTGELEAVDRIVETTKWKTKKQKIEILATLWRVALSQSLPEQTTNWLEKHNSLLSSLRYLKPNGKFFYWLAKYNPDLVSKLSDNYNFTGTRVALEASLRVNPKTEEEKEKLTQLWTKLLAKERRADNALYLTQLGMTLSSIFIVNLDEQNFAAANWMLSSQTTKQRASMLERGLLGLPKYKYDQKSLTRILSKLELSDDDLNEIIGRGKTNHAEVAQTIKNKRAKQTLNANLPKSESAKKIKTGRL